MKQEILNLEKKKELVEKELGGFYEDLGFAKGIKKTITFMLLRTTHELHKAWNRIKYLKRVVRVESSRGNRYKKAYFKIKTKYDKLRSKRNAKHVQD